MPNQNFRIRSAVLLHLLLGVTCAASLRAQSIQLDKEFGYTPIDFATAEQRSSQATHVFLQPSGRIVIYGRHLSGGPLGTLGFAACGLSPGGGLDGTFGEGGGTVQFDRIVTAIAPLSTGQYLKLDAVTSPTSAALNRMNSNGSTDSSFAADLNVGVSTTPLSMTMRSDGKILVLVRATGGDSSHWLVRLNHDGTRDASFGTNGVLFLNLRRLSGVVVAGIHSLPDNRIVLGGYLQISGDPSNGYGAWAARFDENGYYDRRFGLQGIARVPIGPFIRIAKTLVQPDGKVLLVGRATDGSRSRVLLVRLTTGGRLDAGFGQNGVVVATSVSPDGSDVAYSAALTADGKLIVVGSSAASQTSFANFLIMRFATNGLLESHLLTEFTPNQNSFAFDVAIQPDGKVVVVGSTRNPNKLANGDLFAVARYTQ